MAARRILAATLLFDNLFLESFCIKQNISSNWLSQKKNISAITTNHNASYEADKLSGYLRSRFLGGAAREATFFTDLKNPRIRILHLSDMSQNNVKPTHT